MSEPSVSEENVCQTPMDVPYKSPDGVQVFGTEPGNLVIQWQPMNKHDWNAPQLRYLIRYRLMRKKLKQDTFPNYITKSENNYLFDKYSRLTKSDEKWKEFFMEDSLAVIF